MDTVQMNNSFSNTSVNNNCMYIFSDDTPLYFASVVIIANLAVGLPANAWVVWLICHESRELLALEIYSLSLAVCEILYCVGVPAQLYCMFTPQTVSDSVKIVLLMQLFLAWVGRPLFQGFICADWYMAVVHPLIFLRLKPLKYRVPQCALAWISFILTIILIPGIDNIGRIWFFCTFCLLVFSTVSVLWSLKQPGPGERVGGQRTGSDQMKRKAFNIILVNLVCFLVNYLPALIYRFLVRQMEISNVILCVFLFLGAVRGQVQPILYLNRVGKLTCSKKRLTCGLRG